MAENEGAGTGDDSGQGGSGAPSGGSSEGGSENDDKPITARQLKAALASQKRAFEDQIAAKDRELAAFKEGVGQRQVEKPKVYSKTELKAAVEAGQISQEQADEVWDRQRDSQIREAARTEALEAVKGQSTKERIDDAISKYRQLKPEIMERGSETRERISEEYKYLVSAGSPESVATELAAIRAVLGPLEKLEKAASARRSADHEQQGGGSGDGKPKGGGSSKKLVDHLKDDAKEYYERGIKGGRYKGWDDVEAELKYASPSVKRRLGLPA
jgi:hypothetical protein